jgi:hypothetical protein
MGAWQMRHSMVVPVVQAVVRIAWWWVRSRRHAVVDPWGVSALVTVAFGAA